MLRATSAEKTLNPIRPPTVPIASPDMRSIRVVVRCTYSSITAELVSLSHWLTHRHRSGMERNEVHTLPENGQDKMSDQRISNLSTTTNSSSALHPAPIAESRITVAV